MKLFAMVKGVMVNRGALEMAGMQIFEEKCSTTSEPGIASDTLPSHLVKGPSVSFSGTPVPSL